MRTDKSERWNTSLITETTEYLVPCLATGISNYQACHAWRHWDNGPFGGGDGHSLLRTALRLLAFSRGSPKATAEIRGAKGFSCAIVPPLHTASSNVRVRGRSGKHMLALSLTLLGRSRHLSRRGLSGVIPTWLALEARGFLHCPQRPAVSAILAIH